MFSLETMLSWLIEHGAFLDHSVYCDLAQRISSSPLPTVIKRDAILFLHRTMKQRRVIPDYTFFATTLHCIMACRDPEPCAAILLSMKSAGVRMDQPLYSLLTVFLLRCGEVALAEQVDEDMRTGATEQQVALHYGYLRAFQDRFFFFFFFFVWFNLNSILRGELNGVSPNTVIPGLEVYYQQQSSPYPLRFPLLYPLLPIINPATRATTSNPPTSQANQTRWAKKRNRMRARLANQATPSTSQPHQSTQPNTSIQPNQPNPSPPQQANQNQPNQPTQPTSPNSTRPKQNTQALQSSSLVQKDTLPPKPGSFKTTTTKPLNSTTTTNTINKPQILSNIPNSNKVNYTSRSTSANLSNLRNPNALNAPTKNASSAQKFQITKPVDTSNTTYIPAFNPPPATTTPQVNPALSPPAPSSPSSSL
jgi:hypothetical protein